jgi:hypothetical protein
MLNPNSSARAHLGPHHWRSLFPKRSLRRLHLRSYPGAAKLSPLRWATATQRLLAVLGFPRSANFYCSPLSVRRRYPAESVWILTKLLANVNRIY